MFIFFIFLLSSLRGTESPQGVVVTRCHLVGDEKSGDISDAEGPRRCRGAESRDRPSRQTLSADVKSSLKAASPGEYGVKI